MTTFPYAILDWYWLFISSTHHIHISTNETKWSKTAKISGNSPAIAGYKWQDFFVSLSFFSPQTDSGVKRVSRKWPEGGWARHPPLHSVSTGDNQLYGLCNLFTPPADHSLALPRVLRKAMADTQCSASEWKSVVVENVGGKMRNLWATTRPRVRGSWGPGSGCAFVFMQHLWCHLQFSNIVVLLKEL